MDLLRFITAGSVDDGKSTLIGRLLYDSKNILIDQMEALEKSTKNKENGEVDLALLTDGLRAEREQGITIDVAYRYFSTPKRKFKYFFRLLMAKSLASPSPSLLRPLEHTFHSISPTHPGPHFNFSPAI